MKASKVCRFGNAFVKVKFFSAACHRKEPLSLALSGALGAPSPRNNPGLLHRTNPGTGSPNRTPAPPEMGTHTQGSAKGGFHGGVKGNQPSSAAPHNGTRRRGGHSGSAQGSSPGARRAPLPRLAGARGWPGPPPVTAGAGQRLAGRARHCFPPARPPASQAAPRPRCLRRAWHRRGLGEPSKQRERRPGPRLGKRAAGKWHQPHPPAPPPPHQPPAASGEGRGEPGRGAPVAPRTLTQRRPRCPAPGAGLFPGTSAVRPGLRRHPGSAGSNLRGRRSCTHRGGGEGGAGSAVAFAGPGPASAPAPSLAVPPPPCSWRRRRFLRLLCPHPSVLGGAHGGGEPAMAAACRRHGYGCGARVRPGGGRRAAGIPAPSSACSAAPAARRTPPALCGPSAPQKPGPFPYWGLGAWPRARSRLAAAGNPWGAAGSRAGMEAGRRSGFVSPGPFRAPLCDRSAGLQELLSQVHWEPPPRSALAGAAPRW